MKLVEHALPRSHVVIDDFLPPDDLARIWWELRRLEPKLKIGLQGGDQNRYRELKRNRTAVIDGNLRVGGTKSEIVSRMRARLWDDTLLEALRTSDDPAFQILSACECTSLQLSTYGDGEHYGSHRDENWPSNLTVVLFLCREPKQFSGGNFVLEHGGKSRTVGFRNNRLLVFPSNTLHRVTPVRMRSRRLEDMRITLQVWPELRLAPRKPVSAKQQRARTRALEQETLVPYFAIDEDVLADVCSFLARIRSRRGIVKDVDGSLLALRMVCSALESNLRYLARLQRPDDKVRIASQFFSSADELLRVTVEHGQARRGHRFGYALTNKGLRLIALASDRSEKQVPCSPGLAVGQTLALLARLTRHPSHLFQK